MEANEVRFIDLQTEYDEIMIVPPYTVRETLEKIVDRKLAKNMIYQTKHREAYYIFVLLNGSISQYAMLNSKVSTADGEVLYIQYPNQLKLTYHQRTLRPYRFTGEDV
jgi:hypothetical protein